MPPCTAPARHASARPTAGWRSAKHGPEWRERTARCTAARPNSCCRRRAAGGRRPILQRRFSRYAETVQKCGTTQSWVASISEVSRHTGPRPGLRADAAGSTASHSTTIMAAMRLRVRCAGGPTALSALTPRGPCRACTASRPDRPGISPRTTARTGRRRWGGTHAAMTSGRAPRPRRAICRSGFEGVEQQHAFHSACSVNTWTAGSCADTGAVEQRVRDVDSSMPAASDQFIERSAAWSAAADSCWAAPSRGKKRRAARVSLGVRNRSRGSSSAMAVDLPPAAACDSGAKSEDPLERVHAALESRPRHCAVASATLSCQRT